MREWLQAQLENGFPAFAGSAVKGTLAIEQGAANDLLARWLTEATQPETERPASTVRSTLRLIKVLKIRAEPGTILLDFEIVV
jgi:hypothetical protein